MFQVYTHLKCRKKLKGPIYSSEDIKSVKNPVRPFITIPKNQTFVMDDEKYFSLSDFNMPGN